MRAYVSAGRTGGEPAALRAVNVYASLGNAGKSSIDRGILEQAQVKAYASRGAHGFPQAMGAVKLKAHASVAQPMGLERNLEEVELADTTVGYPHVLVSFIYDQKQEFFEKKLGYTPASWMGDSGAYTVWTKGQEVDVDAYIAWSQHYLTLNPDFTVVSLDVLPGEPRRPPTAKERDRGMKQSLENGDRLRAAGLRIIEVYHLYEPLDFFETLLERRQPGETIGLGALVSRAPATVKREFVETSFAYLRDNYGWDKLPPVHGFGVAPTSNLGEKFPWWSTDSSSWMAPAQFGKGIGRSGKATGDDTRTSNRTVRTLYLTRVLENWNRRELSLTKLWHDRGIRFAP